MQISMISSLLAVSEPNRRLRTHRSTSRCGMSRIAFARTMPAMLIKTDLRNGQ